MQEIVERFSGRNFFFISVGVSLVLHILGFLALNGMGSPFVGKPLKQIEVTYMKLSPSAPAVAKENKLRETDKVIENKSHARKIEIIDKEYDVFDTFNAPIKDYVQLKGRFATDEKKLPTMISLDSERKVSVPMMKSDKITNPQYLSYNQNIHARILQRAYQYTNHPDFESGYVYVTFVLSNNGSVQDVRILDERTDANNYLRDVGRRSVRESGPFPKFPKNLNYNELTFNVVITFNVVTFSEVD